MIEALQAAIRDGRIAYGPHFARQMARHGLTLADIAAAFGQGAATLVEDYPEDVRGHSCLLLGFADGAPIHLVCTAAEPAFLITVYRRDAAQWSDDFRSRH